MITRTIPLDTDHSCSYLTRRYTTPVGEIDVTINGSCIVESHYILSTPPPSEQTTTDADRQALVKRPHQKNKTGGDQTVEDRAREELAPPPNRDDDYRRLLATIGTQLDEYFSGQRMNFDVPLAIEDDASDFTKAVREEMARIQPGDVVTYGELAEAAGHPRAARAVGTVCRLNPCQLFIPCHRVIASGGSLGGYMGGARGLFLKQQLLEIEGVPFTENGKVDLNEYARQPRTTVVG